MQFLVSLFRKEINYYICNYMAKTMVKIVNVLPK